MAKSVQIVTRINGVEGTYQVDPRLHLVDFLREEVELKTSRVGCEQGVCGACTVRLDGEIIRGCLFLAVQADGREIDTIDGISDQGELRELQQSFHDHNAAQCGYCTPGMLLTAAALLREKPQATREQVREYISGNYCRCTGYHSIVDAVCEVLELHRQPSAKSA